MHTFQNTFKHCKYALFLIKLNLKSARFEKMVTKKKIAGNFKGADVISLDQFTSTDIEKVLQVAKELSSLRIKATPSNLLSGHIISLLFYEPSTRTFSSFAAAAKQLGAQTLEIHDTKSSSVAKGESLEDTIHVMQSYSDLIILRHPESGSAKIAADTASIPVINAGDGTNEHPTQTLLDLYTIFDKTQKLENLTGVLAGDMLNGRTVKSLIRGLSLFKNNTLYLLSPEELKLTKNEFNELGKTIKLVEITSMKDIPKSADFWYWTRVQKERFNNVETYEKLKHSFVLRPELISEFASKNTIFMHPLPRIGEIDIRVDQNPNALYLSEQMKNGVYVRMALLSLLLGKLT